MIKPPEAYCTPSSLLEDLKPEEEFHIPFTLPGPQCLRLLESIMLLMGGTRKSGKQGPMGRLIDFDVGSCYLHTMVLKLRLAMRAFQSLEDALSKELLWYYRVDTLNGLNIKTARSIEVEASSVEVHAEQRSLSKLLLKLREQIIILFKRKSAC
jgi:hypothetical protein